MVWESVSEVNPQPLKGSKYILLLNKIFYISDAFKRNRFAKNLLTFFKSMTDNSFQNLPSPPSGDGGMKLDILAIGVHPDDVELGCSGTLINEVKLGKKIGIVDLTQGELGTRGTVETRYQEAANAAILIGASVRENLRMRDGFFKNDE